MTVIAKSQILDEENYYQLLEVPNTAALMEIRNAYEAKLEETHLEALAAYSLLPEEITEDKLLRFSQAFMILANPIARAKYDDELLEQITPATEKTSTLKESFLKSEENNSSRFSWKTSKTESQPEIKNNIGFEEKNNDLSQNNTLDDVGQTHLERQDYYLNLAAKNEQAELSLTEYFATLKAYGGKLIFNGAVLKQIRQLKLITLDELVKITCIRSTYLKAIEDENFDIFSSEIYLKGYLACYVEAMNLPAEQILEEYLQLYKNSR
ncbi:MAG: helix-turn-helix domain-containing protein [SAR324 cluster bacterium]|nr:helix-turn-helix domain-containing protein [SAR324 cluster bacterium]MBL7035638.1 helix-turn-helix domain-containing protein [SAR324 cluster bacterium]